MRYFKLSQDRNLRNVVVFDGLEGCPETVFDKETVKTFRRSTALYVKATEDSVYPDLIQTPVLMISEKVFKILRFYDIDTIYKGVTVTDFERKKQTPYRLMVPETEDYISDQSEYYENGFMKRIVLKKGMNPERRIFYVEKDNVHYLIVTEDVLESILSRNCIGIKFEEIFVEE